MPNLNYNNKKFRVISSSENSEIGSKMIFNYKQNNSVLQCNYSGESILAGNLLGKVLYKGEIQMSYHQINNSYELQSGTCLSIPEIMPNGKIRLHETWQWTSGDKSTGTSILEEL